MIAKIIQGTDFNGVINYMLNKPDDLSCYWRADCIGK